MDSCTDGQTDGLKTRASRCLLLAAVAKNEAFLAIGLWTVELLLCAPFVNTQLRDALSVALSQLVHGTSDVQQVLLQFVNVVHLRLLDDAPHTDRIEVGAVLCP